MAEGTEWKDALPPEVRDHPSMKDVKTPGDLAKSWVGAQHLIGGEKLALPKDPKDPAWGAVYNRLGRPEKAEGYKMPELKGLPDGFTVHAEGVTEFLGMAHKLGLSQAQTAELYSFYTSQQGANYKAAVDQQESGRSAAEQALKLKWGVGYEAQKSLAWKTLQYAAGEDAQALSEAYGTDPRFISMVAKLGGELHESVMGPGTPRGDDLTPDAAMKQIAEMLGNKEHPFNIAEHPDHARAVEEHTKLYQLAYPANATN